MSCWNTGVSTAVPGCLLSVRSPLALKTPAPTFPEQLAEHLSIHRANSLPYDQILKSFQRALISFIGRAWHRSWSLRRGIYRFWRQIATSVLSDLISPNDIRQNWIQISDNRSTFRILASNCGNPKLLLWKCQGTAAEHPRRYNYMGSVQSSTHFCKPLQLHVMTLPHPF